MARGLDSTDRVTVPMKPETERQIDTVAKSKGVSLATISRWAIEKYLKDAENAA